VGLLQSIASHLKSIFIRPWKNYGWDKKLTIDNWTKTDTRRFLLRGVQSISSHTLLPSFIDAESSAGKAQLRKKATVDAW